MAEFMTFHLGLERNGRFRGFCESRMGAGLEVAQIWKY